MRFHLDLIMSTVDRFVECMTLTSIGQGGNDIVPIGEIVMLNILTSPVRRIRFCDGVSRRSFLQVGSLGIGGFSLSLPKLLRAEADGVLRMSNKSVIMVYLSGGIAHQDTVDLKPDAPDGIRG